MYEKLIPSRRPGKITCVLGAASVLLAFFCIVATWLDVLFPFSFLLGVGALLLPLIYGVTEMNHTGDYYERYLIKMGIAIGCAATVVYLIGVGIVVPIITGGY